MCFLGFLVLAMTFSDCLLTLRGCYRASANQAAGDELGTHSCALIIRRVHQREAQITHVKAEQLHGCLDGNRVDGTGQRGVRRLEGIVKTRSLVGLTGVSGSLNGGHLGADDVRGDADAAGTAEQGEGRHQVVIAGVERQLPRLHDLAGLIEIGHGLFDGDHRVDAGKAIDKNPEIF